MTSEENIYAYARSRVLREHADRIAGSPDGLVLAVCTAPPSPAAENALDKSFERLGFGAGACCTANLAGLSADEAFDLVEGIDPVALVVTDEATAALCAEAVGEPLPLERELRFFGRETRAFRDLNAMFGTERDRQLVWRLLKSMA